MKDLERAREYMRDKRLEDTGRGWEQLWGVATGQHSGRWARRSHGAQRPCQGHTGQAWGGHSGIESEWTGRAHCSSGPVLSVADENSVARPTLVLLQVVYFVSSWKLLGFLSSFGCSEVSLRCF